MLKLLSFFWFLFHDFQKKYQRVASYIFAKMDLSPKANLFPNESGPPKTTLEVRYPIKKQLQFIRG